MNPFSRTGMTAMKKDIRYMHKGLIYKEIANLLQKP